MDTAQEIRLGDVVLTRKQHPCGSSEWTVIRTGADRASVQAVFDIRGNERALSLLDEWGLEAEDGYLAVGRELSSSGRNLCRIGGEVATLSQLRQLTTLLVELHGQHEHQGAECVLRIPNVDHIGIRPTEKLL